jgi:hypothetical protein
MAQKQSVNIRKISKNRAEQVGYYRFLENENVTIGELVTSLGENCALHLEGTQHVLAIGIALTIVHSRDRVKSKKR